MHSTISARRFWVSNATLALLAMSPGALAQAPTPAATPAAAAPGASSAAEPPSNAAMQAPAADVGAPALDSGAAPEQATPAFTTGFEAGLRLGIGLPVGNAGKDAFGLERKLSDLVTWRTPIWVDATYRVSPGASYGLYAQFGVGGTGDACVGKCDWSDLRIGAQGQWRFNAGSNVEPWLGLGVGYESLGLQTLASVPNVDSPTEETFPVRVKERLGGPELLLQGGLQLRVENALQLGPFLAASVGSYIGDRYRCDLVITACPVGSSVEGSAFHAWLGLGVSGRYSP
jgi:hypothetical protein